LAKRKTVYVCTECGADFGKWQGQCAECKEWNTLSSLSVETAASASRKKGFAGQLEVAQTLAEVSSEDMPRISSGLVEFDRVLGGGFVPGSAVLIGGSPGAGKSTLLIQIMCKLSLQYSALYITGEESLAQIAMRAKRLQLPIDKLMVMSQTNVEAICATWDELKPKLLVIDSIQVMHLDEVLRC
jgi:DNA repair protein RadA/Sms